MSNAWGGAVTVAPATVRLAGDAFTVGLSGLPARACVPFVSAIAGDANVRDVIVGNTSVLLGNGGTLDIPGLGLACGADGAVVDVVYYSGLVAGSSVAVVPTLPLPSTPAVPGPSTPTPAGPVSTAPSVPDAVPGVPGSVSPSPGVAPSPAVPPLPVRPALRCLSRSQRRSPPRLRRRCAVPAIGARRPGELSGGHVGHRDGAHAPGLRSRRRGSNSDAAWKHPEAWVQAQTVAAVTTRIARPARGPPVRNAINGSPRRKPARRVKLARTPGKGGRCGRGTCLPIARLAPPLCPAPLMAAGPTGWIQGRVATRSTHASHGCSLQRWQLAGCGVALGRWAGRAAALGFSGISYWYPDAVVRLTAAEKAKLDWAIANVPIQRVETPAPMPGNWPANVSESAFYEEQCNALSDAGNIRYAYSYDFECVSNMGMHYCDYNWTSGGTSLAVCRQACASDLVGKTNNPYRWEWPESSVVASTPYSTCTGQPGCTPNGGFGTQQGLPACNEHNVGQTLAFNWYRQFYNPVRVDYQEITLTCRGPT